MGICGICHDRRRERFPCVLADHAPQIKPALIAVSIISAINYWNDYFTPYMYLRAHPTVAVGLQSIVNMMTAQSDWPKLFAAMIISIIPVMALFIVFQKTIMENTVAGGLKG